MGEQLFIGISGIISAGKSTITGLLSDRLGYKAFYEPVKTNPYLDDFYKDTPRWAAFMQLHLLHARFCQHQQVVWSQTGAVQDRTIYEDTIFAKMLYESGMITDREMETYQLAFANMTKYLVYPDMIIHLDVEPERALERIRERGRKAEQDISLEYMVSLADGYHAFIEEISRYTLVIHLDWNSYGSIDGVVEKIEDACNDARTFLRDLKRLGSCSVHP